MHVHPSSRRGFTLVEVLVAAALALLVMFAAVEVFARVSTNISGQRGIIETSDRLRTAHERIARDLRWCTAPMTPPLRPADGLGYMEIVEGRPNLPGNTTFVDAFGAVNTTIADHNDIIMFTARSDAEPFVGRFGTTVAQSQVAEIAWFVRGTTLYRRVLLVAPGLASGVDANSDGVINQADYTGSFYANYDLSVRQAGGPWDLTAGSGAQRLELNTLSDLTRRENRYAHLPINALNTTASNIYNYPHGVNVWGQLGLPTLRECSQPNWPMPLTPNSAPYTNANHTLAPVLSAGSYPILPASAVQVDLWNSPYLSATGNRWAEVNRATGCLADYSQDPPTVSRVAEDVMLTNVIGFDIKVWDPLAPLFSISATAPDPRAPNPTLVSPGDDDYSTKLQAFVTGGAGAPAIVGRGAYVDIGYAVGIHPTPNSLSHFAGPGYNNHMSSHFNYDTASTHYEGDGIDQDGVMGVDQGTDGFDNNGVGGVDDASEQEAPPPYPFSLRGVQIRIRVFEPSSRQVRETTILQDFLPE